MTTDDDVYLNLINHVGHDNAQFVESFDSSINCPGYLRMSYEDRSHLFLLDSGCDLSVFPAKLVNRQDLTPFTRNTITANGSSIKILGETVVEFELDGMIVLARVLVSPKVIEPMLSRQWLKFNCVDWPFEQDAVTIRGRRFILESRQSTVSVRRIVTEEAVVLPPLSQTEVSGRVELSNLAQNGNGTWATEVTVCKPGACVARSVFSEQCNGLPVLILNVTEQPINLEPGTVLSDLSPVVCTTSTEVRDWSIKLDEAINQILGRVDTSVSDSEKNALRKLLYKYADVISLGEFDIGLTDLVEHEIDTGNSKPVKQALRRQPYVYLPKIDEHVEQMVKAGWVTPINSPWSTNIVCVKKTDGSIRYCADMRAINNVTRKDSYPLPNIMTCLEALSGAIYYSSIDLISAFHQVKIKESDVAKTTFVTRTGTYAYKRMCFGLSNASATFSRLIDLAMKGLHYSIVILYLDDILIPAPDIASMLERIELVLQRLQIAKLKVKPSKCHFLQTEVTFLGFVINRNGVSTCPSKIAEVVNWPVPANAHDIKSFLGLCSYYRRFIKHFSDIGAPINRLTSAKVKFNWTNECQIAFDTLKTRLRRQHQFFLYQGTNVCMCLTRTHRYKR